MVREVETEHKFGEKPWLTFEHVTMTPIGHNLIDPSLLTTEETRWVNNYHQEVWDRTHRYFEKDELSLGWLKRETQPLNIHKE